MGGTKAVPLSLVVVVVLWIKTFFENVLPNDLFINRNTEKAGRFYFPFHKTAQSVLKQHEVVVRNDELKNEMNLRKNAFPVLS